MPVEKSVLGIQNKFINVDTEMFCVGRADDCMDAQKLYKTLWSGLTFDIASPTSLLIVGLR